MSFEWLVWCLYLLSACFCLLAVKNLYSLFKLSWNAPFTLLQFFFYSAITLILLMSIQQFSYFIAGDTRQAIASIHIEKMTHQRYQVSLKASDHKVKDFKYSVYGDAWQVDFKLLTWNALFSYVGLSPLYRFERLNGRYSTIEDELKQPRSIYALNDVDSTKLSSIYGIKLLELCFVRGFFGASVYAPMADNAEFSVYLTDTGLELSPLNKEAKYVLKNWN